MTDGKKNRMPTWFGWALSATATFIWAGAVIIADLEQRVFDNWEAALTMVFGSFLSGSSPAGGGAVAFPVFTKALEIPAPVARTFGLSIQTVGMSMASLSILLSGRPFHRRAAILGALAAVAGFLGAIFFLGEPDVLFWPPSIGSAWVKATFSIVLATTSILMVHHLLHGDDAHAPPHQVQQQWNRRYDLLLILVAVAGGMLSSLTGVGANILVFLFLVVLADVLPKTALPTAILVMTAVSILGFVIFGLIDGQLNIETAGDRVVAVGGVETDLAANQADLLGLWLAAVPVVVWGAPLGSLCASLVKEHHLVIFVAGLAAIEVISTFLLVPELRSDAALIIYLIVGLIGLPIGLIFLRRHRAAVFATRPVT